MYKKKVDTQPFGVSPISVVPKKNKELRLIPDLRHLNSFCAVHSVIYEDIKTVIDYIEREEFLITTDIKNGFHHIGIHPEDQKYLGFQFEGQLYIMVRIAFWGIIFAVYFLQSTQTSGTIFASTRG